MYSSWFACLLAKTIGTQLYFKRRKISSVMVSIDAFRLAIISFISLNYFPGVTVDLISLNEK